MDTQRPIGKEFNDMVIALDMVALMGKDIVFFILTDAPGQIDFRMNQAHYKGCTHAVRQKHIVPLPLGRI